MKTKKSEKSIQSSIINYLKSKGIYYVKTQRTSMNGVPDIICCVNGHFVGIEVKAEGKRQNISALQTKNLAAIRINGGNGMCTDNPADVILMVERILNG